MAIPLLAVAGVAQAGLGAYQMIKANKMKANRPTMQVSQEAKDIEATYGQMAQGGVPGSKEEIENIQKSRQNSLTQAGRYTSSSGNMLQMIGQTSGQEQGAMRGAEIDRQKTQMNLVDMYMKAKQNVGEEKQRAWQYNLAQKYEEDASAKSAMAEGGIQNIFGALKTGSAIQETGGLGNVGKSSSTKIPMDKDWMSKTASKYDWLNKKPKVPKNAYSND